MTYSRIIRCLDKIMDALAELRDEADKQAAVQEPQTRICVRRSVSWPNAQPIKDPGEGL